MSEELRQSLCAEFASDLARAIESMTSEQPKLTLGNQSPPAAGENTCWRQTFTAGAGAAWLVGLAAAWASLGARTLRAAGIEETDPETSNSTFIEILSQAFSMLARSLSGRTNSEWNCSEGGQTTAAAAGSLEKWTAIHLSFADGVTESLYVSLDDILLANLEPPPSSARAMVAAPVPPPVVHGAFEKSKTLDLLLDVELPVSISFGRAQLPLKDVIKLTTGCIVELNRTLAEPVEVIVNNCVIARGEVVVVEGNFGVRIKQVVSREERLRTLY